MMFYVLIFISLQLVCAQAIALRPLYSPNIPNVEGRVEMVGQTKEVNSILNRVGQIMAERNVPVNTELLSTSATTSAPTKTDDRTKNRLEYYLTNGGKLLHRHPGGFLDGDSDSVDSINDYEGKYFEGDIILTTDQAEELLDEVRHSQDRRHKRKFVRSSNYRWNPNQPIEYSFDGSHSLEQRMMIRIALQHWSNITCLNFKETTSPPHGSRIVFTNVDGCASNVGRHPLGEPQFVSIAHECMRLGVIAHEIAHALGFWHEQSRPDRDNYVSVQWTDIADGQAGQFTKELQSDVETSGIPYDYGSIMHYRARAFSKSDGISTIKTNVQEYQNTIGQREQLSFYDIKLMNTMYCASTCHLKLPCQRGGFTDPRNCDQCQCPDGFIGKLCEEVMAGYDAHCGGEIHVGPFKVVEIMSPNYPENFNVGQECSWLIKAPPGMKIELTFVDEFNLFCNHHNSLCMDYVELRNSSDFANTGMRFCCSETPKSHTLSNANEMLVLFRSFYKFGVGFKARLRAFNPSGSWNQWQEWSQCSASCGGCGERIRRRKCQNGSICSGSNFEREPCNTHVCSQCNVPQRSVVPCGVWGLFRCEKVTAKFASCDGKDQCCPGFSPLNNYCVKESPQLRRIR